jgi:hypothetical protein
MFNDPAPEPVRLFIRAADKTLVTVNAAVFQKTGQRACPLNVRVWLKHSRPFRTEKKMAVLNARPVREVTLGTIWQQRRVTGSAASVLTVHGQAA